jgi:hypothetical protein
MVLWLSLAKSSPTKLNLGLRSLPLLYHYITVQADIYGIAAIPADNQNGHRYSIYPRHVRRP